MRWLLLILFSFIFGCASAEDSIEPSADFFTAYAISPNKLTAPPRYVYSGKVNKIHLCGEISDPLNKLLNMAAAQAMTDYLFEIKYGRGSTGGVSSKPCYFLYYKY